MQPYLAIAVALTLNQASPASPAADAFFEAKIRPVLVESCFKCHGGMKVSNKLRVDSREALVKGGKSGPALVPGQPDKSLLLQAMRHAHEDFKMPPGQRLPAHVVKDFADWIERGAAWPKSSKAGFDAKAHWAFQPIKNTPPPDDPTGWAKHPIDRYIAAKLRDQGLKPVGAAEARTLIRRLTFDLTGLPPTPAEVEEFLSGDLRAKPQAAWDRVVDRLLASPHYGERWGRHWMDVVRYADTAGDNADYPIPEMVRYRDYIIDAFNADKPFDQFVREQIAGDLLKDEGGRMKDERIIATGFLALSRRYATAPYEFMHLTLEDAIDTTGAAFMGLTMRCARCHDHKFDPITREDYYGLYGIFAGTQFPYAGSEEFASMKKPREHFVPLGPNAENARHDYKDRLNEVRASIRQIGSLKDKSPERKKEIADLQRQETILVRLGMSPDMPSAYGVRDVGAVEAKIQLQGDPEKPGAVVPRRVPKFIEGKSVAFPTNNSGRLELARWITRPNHPLTPRVLVNRVWQYHFGQGLVTTPNNFGTRGEAPSHPELLDHLASEFVKHGWSIKWLHRYILTSKTYQLASNPTKELLAKDPNNRWLGRYSRRRLDAESLRDAMLAVSGKLDRKRPGPHPFPTIDKWNWTQHNPFKDIYPSNHRSVYLMTQRIQRHPFLALFDGPDTNASTEKRTESLVPLQALYLMNHPFVREQAEALAKRMLEVPADKRITWAHELAWGRPANKAEIANADAYVKKYRDELKRTGEAADRLELSAWTSYARVLLTANEFVFVE